MAKEYIERDSLIEEVESRMAWHMSYDSILEAIQGAPAADVVEVVHAQWEIEMDNMGWNKHTCPNCGYVKRTDIHVSLGWNFCPMCGADIRERRDNDENTE